MPEAAVKQAFAAVIGEPYVSKNWGGEPSACRLGDAIGSDDFAVAAPRPPETFTMVSFQSGKRSPNIGRPLADSDLVASS